MHTEKRKSRFNYLNKLFMKKIFALTVFFILFSHLAFTQPKNDKDDESDENNEKNEITVLFVYTKKVALEIGNGAKTIQEQTDFGIKQLNECLKNSQIGVKAVAIPELVEVDVSNDISDARKELDELTDVNGKYNQVHKIRRQKKADIVCLITTGDKKGVANMYGDMMVCYFNVFNGSYIFPHEFGHNLGADHYPGEGSGASNDYLIEYRGELYRTVSNNGGVSIPYYAEDKTIEYEFRYQDRNDDLKWKKERKTVKLGDKNYNSVPTMRTQAKKTMQFGENLPPVKNNPDAYTARLVNATTEPMLPGANETFRVLDFTYDRLADEYTFTYNASAVYTNSAREFHIYWIDGQQRDKPLLLANEGLNGGYPGVIKWKLHRKIKAGDILQLRCWEVNGELQIQKEIVVK